MFENLYYRVMIVREEVFPRGSPHSDRNFLFNEGY